MLASSTWFVNRGELSVHTSWREKGVPLVTVSGHLTWRLRELLSGLDFMCWYSKTVSPDLQWGWAQCRVGGERGEGRGAWWWWSLQTWRYYWDSVGQHPAQSRHQMKVSSTNRMNECSVLGVPSWTKRRLHYSKAKNISKINPTTSLAYQSFWGKVNRNCDFWFSAENLEEY